MWITLKSGWKFQEVIIMTIPQITPIYQSGVFLSIGEDTKGGAVGYLELYLKGKVHHPQ